LILPIVSEPDDAASVFPSIYLQRCFLTGHLREHSLLGDPAASSAGGRRLLRETSNFEDACLGNDTSLRNYTSSATISSAVPVVRSPRNTRRTSSVFRAEADGMGARGVLEQRSFESAATPELSDTDEESQPAIGRPRRDPALSGRELT
jgi:hypothetical protein